MTQLLVAVGVTALLVNIFEHKQEARRPFVRLVEVNEATSDPVPWGKNWPYQFDTYKRTVDSSHTEFGGSSAMRFWGQQTSSVSSRPVWLSYSSATSLCILE